MAKYSTGGVGGDAGGSCELCGAESSDLRTASVAGAKLEVCGECARHDEAAADTQSGGGSDRDDDRNRRKRAAQNVARLSDARKVDADFESGMDYQDDPLPYLVRDYGSQVEAARQDAGLQPGELAAEIDVPEADIVAVERGRATRAGVGGSVIAALEEYFDIQLTEE